MFHPRLPRPFWLLILPVLLVGCGETRYEPLADDAVILAFGDSLTAGVGTSKGNDYPSVLASLANQTVINSGVSGETTEHGRPRLAEELERHRPQLVILLEGGNDILRNVRRDKTEANLAAMIEAVKAAGAHVVLIGVPEKKLFSDSAPFYAALAEKYEVPLHKTLLSDLLMQARHKSDSIHLNTAGYRVFAEELNDWLAELGFL